MSLPEKWRCIQCKRLFDDAISALTHAENHVKQLIHKVFLCPNCDTVMYANDFCIKCNKNKYKTVK
jgi:hypothetical protein